MMETQIVAYADIIQAQNELLQVTLAKLPQTSVLEPHLKQELSILRMAEGQCGLYPAHSEGCWAQLPCHQVLD